MFKDIEKPVQYKIVFIGDSGVGKSAIATRIACDIFKEFTEATIGASYFSKIITKNEKLHKFNIWDTAGQEKYNSLVPLYYRNCDMAIIVYDITHKKSYENALKRIPELQKEETVNMICLIGNKNDKNDERIITTNTAKKYCDENNIIFLETSAKSNNNIQEILHIAIDKISKFQPLQVQLPNTIELSSYNPVSNCC
ncbi:MAG: hypothetical protein CL847_04040 [Crocinitomicaceae bacterium]|nr:hypothetical protein [Crocinitomicaceae bacterium]|tara:strand:- start:810 stop:1400 length:591 start_codon:yes stop_codon:yes gene_type:complete